MSSTVRDLVAGSGIRFGEAREVELAGVPDRRTLYPALRLGTSPEGVRRAAIEQANLFRRDGEYWTIGYRGTVVALRDAKGLRDLARLLSQPGREFHVLDLLAEAIRPRSTTAVEAAETELHVEGRGEPVIDSTARARYQRRINRARR